MTLMFLPLHRFCSDYTTSYTFCSDRLCHFVYILLGQIIQLRIHFVQTDYTTSYTFCSDRLYHFLYILFRQIYHSYTFCSDRLYHFVYILFRQILPLCIHSVQRVHAGSALNLVISLWIEYIETGATFSTESMKTSEISIGIYKYW
jgi:hypothetical protein